MDFQKLPFRKRTLPNSPWVVLDFSFISLNVLLSATPWRSSSFKFNSRNVEIFLAPKAGFWKRDQFVLLVGKKNPHLFNVPFLRKISDELWEGNDAIYLHVKGSLWFFHSKCYGYILHHAYMVSVTIRKFYMNI